MSTKHVERDDKAPIVVLLERLNAARRLGDTALAAELDAELDAVDRRLGWTRHGGFTRDQGRHAEVRRLSWRDR